jgi:hypothetical protein
VRKRAARTAKRERILPAVAVTVPVCRHPREVGGDTISRYGDAHDRTKGPERHAGNEVE